MQRRRLLTTAAAGAAVLASAGCAHPGRPQDHLFDTATGREIQRAELLALLRDSRYVLLGEQHDNPHHHARRGALIAELGPGTQVVAEQLPTGALVGPEGAGSDLLARLQAAGFDPKGWGWPLHEALFAPIASAGLPLRGGNALQPVVRQVAREGPSAWPADLRGLLERAPLDSASLARLDADLVAGHCGHLSAARTPAMRAAQRARDASMALALQALPGRAVLVAGNGHVRTDYGVAQLLRALEPQARLLSVGFSETGLQVQGEAGAGPYTHLWITPGVPQRADPCAGFKLPAPRPG